MATNFENIPGKIVLHGRLTAQEGQADKVLSLLKNIQADSTTEKEPGCLTYRITRSGNEFFMFEEYENKDAIKAHFDIPGFKTLVAEIGKGNLVVGGPSITYYQEV